MIDQETHRAVVAATADLWDIERASDAFLTAFRGKERGHRIADLVEEVTVAHLENLFAVKHEMRGGRRRARGMGDLWVAAGGIYNPINVKAGVVGIGGQPNLVSLAKLTNALLDHMIDCYYLLLVKFTDDDPPTPDVELVNLLEHLDFVHFDSGTGQMMLRADRFRRRTVDPEPAEATAIVDVVERLLQMRRNGDEALARNREHKLAALERKAALFNEEERVDQAALELG